MRAIPVDGLIQLFQLMHRERWTYTWGKAEQGNVDCSGAFVYAGRLWDVSYPHGSNAIARKCIIGQMLPISEARPGMAAFKARVPGEKDYALPDKYTRGADLNDYYHIGLIDTDGKHVLNAKGTSYGFWRDELTRSNGWDCVAYLTDVDYGEAVPVEQVKMAKVVLPTGASGTSVNMRKDKDRASQVITRVPVGSEVRVINDAGEWCYIGYGDKIGWMMSNYLEYAGQDGESGAISEEDREAIEAALKQIEAATETIGSILGRG